MTPRTKRDTRSERICLARWWSGKYIRACNGAAAIGHRRCTEHQPDGSRLDRDGMPMKNHVAPTAGMGKR